MNTTIPTSAIERATSKLSHHTMCVHVDLNLENIAKAKCVLQCNIILEVLKVKYSPSDRANEMREVVWTYLHAILS